MISPALRRRRVRRNWIKGLGHALAGRRCPACDGRCLPVAASWMHGYLRCRRCDLIFVAALPCERDLIAAYRRVHRGDYQVQHKQSWSRWMEHKHRTLDALGLARWEEGGGRALDLGCGEGRMLQVLQQRGWQASGVELNPELAAEARQLGLQVTISPVERFSPQDHFDLITMSHLLEHLRAPLELLQRIPGWLTARGLLVIETPLRPDYRNIDHLYCFSAAALSRALSRAGFGAKGWFDYVDDNYRHHNLACLASAHSPRRSPLCETGNPRYPTRCCS